MIIQKDIEICISPGRMLNIKYEFFGFQDDSFSMSYHCPFNEQLVLKYISGSKKDIYLERNSDENSLKGGYMSIYLPLEDRDIELPILRYEFDSIESWINKHD